ncbi:MAG TPA: methyltransferase domain-containing protein [Ktedonobacteraceae bacterium]|nr:methyltransferase domain-containing protein [Ktedonobacteraceae bacterium]
MTQSTLTTSSVFRHCGEEIQCLLRPSRLYDPCTQRLLEQTDITAGMKVLDVGSGAGDVTFLAGEPVGEKGMVVGVEHDLAPLEMAQARACAAGLTQVSFLVSQQMNDFEIVGK